MTITQQAELINIIQFSDLTADEIETLRKFIEEVEDEAYDRGAESCCGVSSNM